MARTSLLLFVVLAQMLNPVVAKALFTVQLLEYREDSHDCDYGFRVSTKCDPGFKVCLSHIKLNKTVGTCTVTIHAENTFYIDFNSSSVAPTVFTSQLDTLQIGEPLQISIDVVDGDVIVHDAMDTLKYTYLGEKTSGTDITLNGTDTNHNIRIDIRIKLECQDCYNGSDCSRFCKNDTLHEYATNGSKLHTPVSGFNGPSVRKDCHPLTVILAVPICVVAVTVVAVVLWKVRKMTKPGGAVHFQKLLSSQRDDAVSFVDS